MPYHRSIHIKTVQAPKPRQTVVLTLMNAVACRTPAAFLFCLNKAILEEHAMFRSKPNAVSVCGGMWRALSFANQIKRHWFHNEASDVLIKGGYFLLFVLCLCYLYLYSKGVLRRVILRLVFASFHFYIGNFTSHCIYFDFSFFTTAIDHI